MKIHSAIFVKSATRKAHYPETALPEVAFVGKSNVGKSSLINSLLNRKNLVKTSSTPGKTQTINFFELDGKLMFTDLPGYGYARVPLSVKKSWGKMVETYLREREGLKLVIFLLDIRRDPGEDTRQVAEWLDYYQVPFLTVITKADKARKSEIIQRRRVITAGLNISTEATVLCSARTGMGRRELWEKINDFVKISSYR